MASYPGIASFPGHLTPAFVACSTNAGVRRPGVAKLINSEVMHVEPSSRTIFVHVSFRVVLVCASHLCITLAVFTGFLHLSCAHLAEYSCCTCHL